MIALHSSDPATVYLSAWARMASPSVEAVDAALYRERSLVRHHAMRRTLWVMSPAIAGLAHAAATAKIARVERKRTVAAFAASGEFGDVGDEEAADAWLDAALAEIVDLLIREGSQSTREIGAALPHLVLPVVFGVKTKHPASLNAHTKVLQGAGFDGVLLRGRPTGTWNSAEYLWTAAGDRLGSSRDLDEGTAAAELLGKWLLRFGPATDTDIRWWFGWTAGLAKRALGGCEAVEVELESGTGWVAAGDEGEVDDPGPWVRLLPGLDPTPMGWKERDWYLEPGDVGELFDRWGNAGPTVWADGRAVGGWVQRADGSVAVELTASLGGEHERLLGKAIDELTAAVGDVVVRPRFPAPVQKRLFS